MASYDSLPKEKKASPSEIFVENFKAGLQSFK
jgi:hypothetical protein